MTSDPAAGSVRFGVVTCGKLPVGPYAEKFGPCILEPGHADDVACRFKNLNGPGSASITEMPVPDEIAAVVADLNKVIGSTIRTRRYLRRSMWLSLAALVANLAAAIWSFGRLLHWWQ